MQGDWEGVLFKNQSIQKKMIISTLVVTLIPLLILEIVFVLIIQNKVSEHVINLASVQAEQLEYNYQKELDILEQTAQTIADSPILEKYLTNEYDSKAEGFAFYSDNIHPMLSSHNRISYGIAVRIYHNYETITNYSFELNNELDKFVEKYFPDDFQFQNMGEWRKDNVHYNNYKAAYSFYLPVRELGWPHEISYVIAIHMDENYLNSFIVTERPEDKLIFVTDKEGNILTTNQKIQFGNVIHELKVNETESFMDLQEKEHITLDGKEYLFMRREAQEFYVFQLVAMDSIVSAQKMSIGTLLIIGYGMLLLMLLLIIGASKELTKGIENLKRKMLNIDRETIHRLAAYDLQENSKDEVKQLEVVFTSMMGEIDILMDKLKFQEMHLKDTTIMRQQAEIQALQRQIDPHYLFNTLESIRMNLIIKGNREDAEIVKLFAESFRRYVDTGEDYAPLLEEVEFVRKYMRIQNYRTGGSVHFQCDASENVLQYRVPKLLLQPLVENAVCHGLENKFKDALIVLRIYEQDHYLYIEILDNGIGMNEEKLADLKEKISQKKSGKSVGLRNVYQRMRLIYGEQAKFAIESEEKIGTKVQLQISVGVLEETKCFES